jgi:hypothetical protein
MQTDAPTPNPQPMTILTVNGIADQAVNILAKRHVPNPERSGQPLLHIANAE